MPKKWFKGLIPSPGEYSAVTLPLSQIMVHEDRGPLNEATVREIARSIRQIGRLIYPLGVTQEAVDKYRLETGHHRHAAAGLEKMESVPCIILDADPQMIKLIRAVDDLCRRDLGPSEYALNVLERAEAIKELGVEDEDHLSESETGAERMVGSFRHQAEITGEQKDKIHRAYRRAQILQPGILKLTRGTCLDKDVELDALAKLPVEERKSRVRRVVAGEILSARTPDGRPRPRRQRNTIAPHEDALEEFREWRAKHCWVEDIEVLRELISKIDAILAAHNSRAPDHASAEDV